MDLAALPVFAAALPEALGGIVGMHEICKSKIIAFESLSLIRETGLVQKTRIALAAEAVQSPALPLEGIHDVHGSNSLSLGVLSVGDGVADNILQKHLQVNHENTGKVDVRPTFKTPLVSS